MLKNILNGFKFTTLIVVIIFGDFPSLWVFTNVPIADPDLCYSAQYFPGEFLNISAATSFFKLCVGFVPFSLVIFYTIWRLRLS